MELCGRYCGCDLNVSSEERRVLVVARFCSWMEGGGSPGEVRTWEAGFRKGEFIRGHINLEVGQEGCWTRELDLVH